MGSPVFSGATLLSALLYLCSVWTQELRDRDALCNDDFCLVLYWQRKIFLDAWRNCKQQDGNLVTIRSPEEANMVETLFSNMELREDQRVRFWIGLQRQPRKCSATRPMRGFSWITGEPDTQYTNWEQEDSSNTCSVPRCVSISYTTAAQESQNNLKWKDGPCSVPVDGYLCRYAFPGMCQAISSEGGGNTLYTTQFQLVTAFLTHIPFGSVATVPCHDKDDQTVLCTQREDGVVSWNRDPPFCSDGPKTSWCHEDKGGCQHYCIEDGDHFYCQCNDGFVLAQDGMTCVQIDPCQESPCEFECLAVMDSYRCACPEGYMLAPDERRCLDVDECLQSPCEHICINAPGTFECRCRDGYRADEEGTCEDVDECADSPCEHDCENVMGSHICHCHLGFAPLPEDPSRCYDVDECQFEGTCEQMCINYNGGYDCYCKEGYELHPKQYSCRPISDNQQSPTVTSSYPWNTHPRYPWSQESEVDYESETASLDLFIDTSNVETVPTDLVWPQEQTEATPPTIIMNVEEDILGPQTESMEALLPSTSSTPLPDYYEDESTTVFTVPPTTATAGGAQTTLRFTPATTEHDEDRTLQTPFIMNTEYDSYDSDTDNYDYESTTSEPELPMSTQLLPATQETVGTNKDGSNNEQAQGSSLLLIGLLVPLCIFIVVMIALGIIYCTRCTAKPQNKNTTDCYHWIAGAGDKAAADMTGGGITKV